MECCNNLKEIKHIVLMPNFRHIMCLSIRRYYKIKYLIDNYSIEREKAIFYIDSLK